MIKGILFDVGNVLITLEDYNPSLKVAQFYNVDFNTAENIFKKHITLLGSKYTGDNMEEKMWKAISEELASNIKEIPYHILHKDFLDCMKKNEKLLNILSQLHKKGLILAILSDTNPIHKELLTPIYNYFDKNKVFLSCDIGFRKDNPQAFKIVLERMNLNAEQIIFIDDLKKNILTAKDLHFKTILAKNENQIIANINNLLKQEN